MLPTNYRGASSVRFVPADFQPTAEQLAIQRCQNRYVIAMSAAGSGKSTTIALKVMENVRYGKDPRKILVLTFSREAAQVIRRMIAKLSNDAQLANAIRCIAFDDFCVEVLNGFGYERADQLSSMDEVCAYVRKAAANIKKREDDRVRPLEIVLPEHNEQIAEFVRNARLMKANLLSPDLDEDETYEDRAIRYGLPESFFISIGR
ncbi:UvrD-helicase domain-containing protein [Thauera humireducens]|uniref:UvrD-helicase domain-containing protein n=1 Tax=Thauera humireducens TaxID=1134435 RepID=UPI00311EE942